MGVRTALSVSWLTMHEEIYARGKKTNEKKKNRARALCVCVCVCVCVLQHGRGQTESVLMTARGLSGDRILLRHLSSFGLMGIFALNTLC